MNYLEDMRIWSAAGKALMHCADFVC